MIIDIHTHIFPDKIADRTIDALSRAAHLNPHTNATAEQLTVSMQEAGIDISVNMPVATAARQVMKLNDSSVRQNEIYFENASVPRILSFGCMHPDYEDWHSELARMKELGLKGFKIHPVYQDTDIDDIRFLRIFERAAELGLTVLTHAGLDIGFPGVVRCSPKMCRHVVDEIGAFPFILAHMGGWRNWDEVPEYLADTGVYLDTAFSSESFDAMNDGYWKEEDRRLMDKETFTGVVRAFGGDRILFGTDSPWASQKETLAFVNDLPVDEACRRKILGENAVKLLFLS